MKSLEIDDLEITISSTFSKDILYFHHIFTSLKEKLTPHTQDKNGRKLCNVSLHLRKDFEKGKSFKDRESPIDDELAIAVQHFGCLKEFTGFLYEPKNIQDLLQGQHELKHISVKIDNADSFKTFISSFLNCYARKVKTLQFRLTKEISKLEKNDKIDLQKFSHAKTTLIFDENSKKDFRWILNIIRILNPE